MADVALKQLGKSYGTQTVLNGIDLRIADGELMVFVGPSGCGKSTLLRMIAGLEDISAGELWIGGALANHIPAAKRGLAMVFQSYALYPHMSVYDNMAFALTLAKQSRAAIDNAVRRAAETLQITHLLERKPKDLSGGQRQRVAIGRAIVRQPGLFLFDEPLSNLDAGLRVQMRIEIARLHRELGATMIYVTHDQVEAMTLGQRIAVFNGGSIVQVGSPLALYEHPHNRFVAGFLGSPKMNFLRALLHTPDARHSKVMLPDGSVLNVAADTSAQATGAALTLGIRAEQWQVAQQDGVQNGLLAEVRLLEHLGDTVIAYVGLPGQEGLFAVKLAALPSLPEPGQRLLLSFDPQQTHLFASDDLSLSRR